MIFVRWITNCASETFNCSNIAFKFNNYRQLYTRRVSNPSIWLLLPLLVWMVGNEFFLPTVHRLHSYTKNVLCMLYTCIAIPAIQRASSSTQWIECLFFSSSSSINKCVASNCVVVVKRHNHFHIQFDSLLYTEEGLMSERDLEYNALWRFWQNKRYIVCFLCQTKKSHLRIVSLQFSLISMHYRFGATIIFQLFLHHILCDSHIAALN